MLRGWNGVLYALPRFGSVEVVVSGCVVVVCLFVFFVCLLVFVWLIGRLSSHSFVLLFVS